MVWGHGFVGLAAWLVACGGIARNSAGSGGTSSVPLAGFPGLGSPSGSAGSDLLAGSGGTAGESGTLAEDGGSGGVLQSDRNDAGAGGEGGEQCADDACLGPRVLALALGNGFSCALAEGGLVRCWGENDANQLGLGDLQDRQTQAPYALQNAAGTAPAGPIDLGGTATAITAGVGHACALLTDGTARCWGDNACGQLGLGNALPQVNVPRLIGAVQVAPDRKIRAISAGVRHTCAVLDDGSATCWGENDYGQLGLGTSRAVSETQTPAQTGAISLGGRVVSLGAGGDFACALLEGGTVRCWGSNNLGRLGTSTRAYIGDDELPSSLGDAGLVPIVAGETVSELKVGGSHVCALLASSRLECWGQNTTGAVGVGSVNNIGDNESPATSGITELSPNARVQSFSLGFGSTCAILYGQGLRCWGVNTKGQAGYPRIDNLGIDISTTPAVLPPVNVGSGRSVKSVFAGTLDVCVILDDGSVKCWGWNNNGQLGLGTVTAPVDFVGVDYVGGPGNTPDLLASIRIFTP